MRELELGMYRLLEWYWISFPNFLIKFCYQVKFPLAPPGKNSKPSLLFSVLDISSYLYCQTPRQKVEIGAITNIAPATFESIQLSLATPLGTCSYCK